MKTKMIKVYFLCFIGIFFTITSNGQTGKLRVGVNTQFNKKDTTRTFVLSGLDDLNVIREKLMKYFGATTENGAGVVTWKDKKIDKLGENLTVIYTDGIFETKKMVSTYKKFKDNEDKEQSIKKITKPKWRCIMVEITNDKGINIVNTKNNEQIITRLLEEIIE